MIKNYKTLEKYSQYYHRALSFEKKRNFKSALDFFNKAIFQDKILKDKNAYASALYHKALLEYISCDIECSKKTLGLSLEYFPTHRIANELKEIIQQPHWEDQEKVENLYILNENPLYNNQVRKMAKNGGGYVISTLLLHIFSNLIENFFEKFLQIKDIRQVFYSSGFGLKQKQSFWPQINQVNYVDLRDDIKHTLDNSSFQIVVARYNENISWATDYSKNICVYNKGTNKLDNSFSLPNIGREFQTYLYHIVNNYDHLAEKTLFLQGAPFEHRMYYIYQYAKTDRDFQILFNDTHGFEEDHHLDKVHWNLAGCKYINGKDKVSFWDLFIQKDKPETLRHNYGAQFSVSRELIRGQPKSYYQKLLDLAEKESFVFESKLNNFCIGVLFEAFWYYIFNHPKKGQWCYKEIEREELY